MTKDKAIQILTDIQRRTPIHTKKDVEDFKALEMAISALKSADPIRVEIAEEVTRNADDWGYVAGLMTAKRIFNKYTGGEG